MNKAPVIFLLILLSASSTHAQEFRDRFFQNIGYTLFLDGFQLPSYSDIDIYGNQVYRLSGISIVTYFYEPRFNLVDLNENTSIDIHAIPALGVSISVGGDARYLGSFSLPILAGINFGNVSTYETRKNVGFGIGLGYEYFHGGLIRIEGVKTPNNKLSTFQPAAQFSVRYWSKTNNARQLSLLLGLGGKNSAKLDESNPYYPPTGKVNGGYHVRLSWAFYLNY